MLWCLKVLYKFVAWWWWVDSVKFVESVSLIVDSGKFVESDKKPGRARVSLIVDSVKFVESDKKLVQFAIISVEFFHHRKGSFTSNN